MICDFGWFYLNSACCIKAIACNYDCDKHTAKNDVVSVVFGNLILPKHVSSNDARNAKECCYNKWNHAKADAHKMDTFNEQG